METRSVSSRWRNETMEAILSRPPRRTFLKSTRHPLSTLASLTQVRGIQRMELGPGKREWTVIFTEEVNAAWEVCSILVWQKGPCLGSPGVPGSHSKFLGEAGNRQSSVISLSVATLGAGGEHDTKGSRGLHKSVNQVIDLSSCYAPSPPGKFIMTASSDTSILIWNLKGQVLSTINTNHMNNTYAAISPCSR